MGALGVLDLIPLRSENRRNIGFMIALERDVDLMISIDDDNIPLSPSWLAEHAQAFQPDQQLPLAMGHWFDPCVLLECLPTPVSSRGMPFCRRVEGSRGSTRSSGASQVVGANGGLWLGDPDVDAVTRLATSPVAISQVGEAFVPAGSLAPLNTQNTAVLGKLLPAFYTIRMGRDIGGRRIERFGDILGGLFFQLVAGSLGYGVRFGGPLSRHDRNEHDLLNDADLELPGLKLLEKLAPVFELVELSETTVPSLYRELAHWLREFAEVSDTLDVGEKQFLVNVATDMTKWIDATQRLR